MKKFDQINVIPFIDIMLVLLAIVLTTASFVSQGFIKVKLPAAETTTVVSSNNKKSIEITVDENKNIYFSNKIITLAQLEKKLQALKKETNIILRVDEQVIFKQFVFVVDLLKKHQLNNLSILTKSKNNK